MCRLLALFGALCVLSRADETSSQAALHRAHELHGNVNQNQLERGSFETIRARFNLSDRAAITTNQHAHAVRPASPEPHSHPRGLLPVLGVPSDVPKFFENEFLSAEIKPSVDWRDNGCVVEPKSQGGTSGGDCVLTCWAFATVGLLEYYNCKSTGQLTRLSEKFLIDCDGNGKGCYGGLVDDALDFIESRRCIATEDAYPYSTNWQQCWDDSPCDIDMSKLRYEHLSGDSSLLQALSNVGPVAVYIYSNITAFEHYSTTDPDDIFSDQQCENLVGNTFDHAVLVVGYGENKNGKYWLVKNSWGRQWGYNGYIKISRDKVNHCNIAGHIFFPKFT